MERELTSPAQQLNEAIGGLEAKLGALEGEPVALAGGITNRNFRVRLGGRLYVLRLHGARTDVLGIDRNAERAANEAAARLGIAPAVAAHGPGYLLTDYVACGALEAEDVSERAGEIARALRAFHESELTLRARFDVQSLLEEYAAAVRRRGGRVPEDYTRAQDVAGRIGQALRGADRCACHNDLLAGNLIGTEDARVLIVDWEYAGMGHAYFDLGNVSVNNGFDEAANERLLEAYLSRAPRDSERATLELMRVLSDAREAAWGVLQAMLSELEFDFGGYARTHFERMLAALEGDDFEGWLAAAA